MIKIKKILEVTIFFSDISNILKIKCHCIIIEDHVLTTKLALAPKRTKSRNARVSGSLHGERPT